AAWETCTNHVGQAPSPVQPSASPAASAAAISFSAVRKNQRPRSGERGFFFAKAGWPTQARFWLEWGSSTAGQTLPAARSRFRAVHSDSISTRPSQPEL